MNNDKGFTLIELLAVIIILTVILVIAVPSITSLIDNSRLSTFKNQQDLMKRAAKLYLSANDNLYPVSSGNYRLIKLSDLISNNYISNVSDPKDKSVCDTTNSMIKVINDGNNSYSYETFLQCANYKTDVTSPLIATKTNGNNLTVIGTDDNALSFDGTSNYGLINASFPATLTIEAWGYAKVISGKMLWSFDSSNYSAGVDLYPECSKFNLNVGDGCANPFANSIYSSLNEWHHYTVVFDQTANLGTFYLDGVAIGTALYKNPAGSKLYIGKYDNGSYFWNGYVKDIRIWSTVRTPLQISNNMNVTLTGSEPGLIGYYKMNEMDGTTLIDYSPNQYNGTIYGNTWQKNSGIKEIRIKQGTTLISSSTQSSYTFTLAAGTYTVEVEDNVGRISTTSVTL